MSTLLLLNEWNVSSGVGVRTRSSLVNAPITKLGTWTSFGLIIDRASIFPYSLCINVTLVRKLYKKKHRLGICAGSVSCIFSVSHHCFASQMNRPLIFFSNHEWYASTPTFQSPKCLYSIYVRLCIIERMVDSSFMLDKRKLTMSSRPKDLH